jgi:Mrp family chromosome partitioning ATPase
MAGKKRQSKIPLITAMDTRSPVVEAYKGLRTNIHLSSLDTPLRTILITSAVRQEGKTTAACNLAITMAEEGKKILLLDADLRIPMLHKLFALDGDRGLSIAQAKSYEIIMSNGKLDGATPSDLLRALVAHGKTGKLTAVMSDEEIVLTLCDRKLVNVRHKGRREEEHLGYILMRSGKLTREKALEALKIQQNSSMRFGQVLLNAGLITPEDLTAALLQQAQESLRKFHLIRNAKFTFQELSRVVAERESRGMPEEFLVDLPAPQVEKRILQHIQETSLPRLHVMCSGPVPSNPSEMLSSGRMRDLLDVLSEHYDRIIVDSPPVVPVADTVILASMVDGVALVIRAGRTNRDVVKRAKEQLEMTKTPILGVVLNDFDAEKSGYDYYKRYYYYRYE